jgi:hypothetical protein
LTPPQVTVLKTDIPKAKFSIEVFGEHNHPTSKPFHYLCQKPLPRFSFPLFAEDVIGYFTQDLPTNEAVRLRRNPEFLSLPVNPALQQAATRLLEAGWEPSKVTSRLLTAHVSSPGKE